MGSVGSQSSSGYSSGELANRGNNSISNSATQQSALTPSHQNPCVLIPLPVFHAITKMNQNCTYVFSYQDLWDQADSLEIKGKHKGKLKKYINIIAIWTFD